MCAILKNANIPFIKQFGSFIAQNFRYSSLYLLFGHASLLPATNPPSIGRPSFPRVHVRFRPTLLYVSFRTVQQSWPSLLSLMRAGCTNNTF